MVQETDIAGFTTIASSYGPAETVERLEAAIHTKELSVFATIDHAAGAAEVGMTLRPTKLIVFGNARGGTPADAIRSDRRNRPAVKGAGLGG